MLLDILTAIARKDYEQSPRALLGDLCECGTAKFELTGVTTVPPRRRKHGRMERE
jgi:hypothetical protein